MPLEGPVVFIMKERDPLLPARHRGGEDLGTAVSGERLGDPGGVTLPFEKPVHGRGRDPLHDGRRRPGDAHARIGARCGH